MAVNDNVGFQQFPQATYPVPNPKEAEEKAAIALNLKDGQKSLGQSKEDPYTRAMSYIEEHRITEVFQVGSCLGNRRIRMQVFCSHASDAPNQTPCTLRKQK